MMNARSASSAPTPAHDDPLLAEARSCLRLLADRADLDLDGKPPLAAFAAEAGLDASDPEQAIFAAASLVADALERPDLATLLMNAMYETLQNGVWTDDQGEAVDPVGFGADVRRRLTDRLEARDAHLALIAMNRGCCG